MNIDYLKNYITIVECQNISAASKKLFIAQPSLSNQIKYLENLYQKKLMSRNGRKIQLTKYGKLLYDKAKHIIRIYEDSFQEMNGLQNGLNGSLNIAIPPTVYKDLINKNFYQFTVLHPNVRLNIYETNAKQAQEFIVSGQCELAITNANLHEVEKYNYKELAQESFKVILPDNSPLLQKDVITINDLKKQRIAIPRGYVSNIIEHTSMVKFSPLIDTTTTSSSGAIEMAILKNIIAVVPLPDDESIDNRLRIKDLKLNNFNQYTRKLIWLKEKELSPIAKNFISCF